MWVVWETAAGTGWEDKRQDDREGLCKGSFNPEVDLSSGSTVEVARSEESNSHLALLY